MDSGKRRSQRDYTLGFKLAVVDQVEKGELSYNEAQRRYGIQGRSTVNRPGFFRHLASSLRNAFQTLPATADC